MDSTAREGGFPSPGEPAHKTRDGKVSRPHFDGPVYEPQHDLVRLTGQIARIRSLMADGLWRTLGEIAESTGDPPASISAQLRHLRKPRFGAYTVEKQARGPRGDGLWEYRLGAPRGPSDEEPAPRICGTCEALNLEPRPGTVRIGARVYCPQHAESFRRIIAAIAEAAMEMRAVGP